MLTPNQIDRLIGAEQYAVLIRRILGNGRSCSDAMERLLLHPEIAASCALGLALQRLAELAYCRSASADRIAARLMALQRRDALFGHFRDANRSAMIAATAVAVRGLEAWRDLQPLSNTALERAVARAIDRGIAALALHLHQSAGADETEATSWVIVLWQLCDSMSIRGRIDVEELREHVAAHAPEDAGDITRLALATAA